MESGVPAIEDRTCEQEAAGTEDMTPRGPKPFLSTSVHNGERDRTPETRQEKEGQEQTPGATKSSCTNTENEDLRESSLSKDP